RGTLFGADRQTNRQPELLDSARESARIRAFFVRPAWARQGIGRALLRRCEAEARAAGFRKAELMATLPGMRLYKAMGYAAEPQIEHDLGGGITIEFVPMRRDLR